MLIKCVWTKCVDKVCVDKVCVDKVCVDKVCVDKVLLEGGRRRRRRSPGYRIKNKNPTQRCGEKDDFEALFKRIFRRKITSAKMEKIC